MIERHYIDIQHAGQSRRVHYRMMGNGPPLLMVHQSPRSSHEFSALMQIWSAHFTCIVPDTPGFGQSDALQGTPDIADYADAIMAFMSAIGVKKCAAYGFHSGGMILVTALKRHPEMFSGVVAGGYGIWSEAEMALFGERYLPPFTPSPYGEHLTWAWNRVLEQSWFFPWFAVDDANRLPMAHDDPARIHAIICDLLDSGDAYRNGYGAVLQAQNDVAPAGHITPKCLIVAYDGDPLQDHIDRLGPLADGWEARKVATPQALESASLDFLKRLDTPPCGALNTSVTCGFIPIKTADFNGLIHWQGMRQSNILHLHEPGGAIALNGRQDAADTPLAMDLPGHGLSDGFTGNAPTSWAPWQAVIDAVAAQFGSSDIKYAALPKGDPQRLYPDLTPDRFGHYLATAWQIVRARTFYDPWYQADKGHQRPFIAADIDPQILAIKHMALLNGRAAKAYHMAMASRLK